METATVGIYMFTTTCAYCEEIMKSKEGEYAFRAVDYLYCDNPVVKCNECGKVNKLPKQTLLT